MPGMMDTVLNLGLNDQTVEAIAANSGDKRFAYDSYRRFITMYSDVVLGVDHHHFEELLDRHKEQQGYSLDKIPFVIQYNKRDLPNIAPVEYLEYMLNRRSRRVPYFESVAVEGKGVFDTLNTVSRMVLVAGFGQEQGALNEST